MLKCVIFDIDGSIPATEASPFNDFILHLKASGLITIRIFDSEEHRLKPAPDIFLNPVKDLGLSPEECLIIDASESGTLAAKAAGIPCIGYAHPNSGNRNLSRAYALLESFVLADAGYLHRTHAHALSYPAKILTTERLIVREFSKEDFPALYAMCTHPETAPFMEEVLSDYATEEEKHLAYISGIYPIFDLALWGIFEKETGKLIGRAGFSLPDDETDTFSLGYLIDVPYRRKGYAKECIHALLSYAKSQGVTTVSARIKKTNIASQNTLHRCGFPYQLLTDKTDTTLTYKLSL